MCAFLFPALSSRGADVSVNLFYDNLSGGNWYDVSDYGYVWQPDVAGDPNWRPYTDGYWAYTDQGWTWVSYEDFGWATYHYGRWARLDDYGWVWMPGTEWAPAWVSWRTGGDYVGWAPLPPADGGEVVYESRPITGQVDIEFGIGPAYYNFVDLRYIGEPVLRDRIVDYNQNVTIVNNTVNVTNITYNKTTVYNYGPDYATVSRYSVRPIQRLKIQRQTSDPLQAVKNGNLTKVQGNTLMVAAPQKLQKPAGAQVAPRQVKAKIEQPKMEKGWANIDAQQKAQLEQKYKTQNAKDVPKPNIQPKSKDGAANAAQPALAASPAESSSKPNRKGQRTKISAAARSRDATEREDKGNKNRMGGTEAPGAEPGAENGKRPVNADADEAKEKRRKENKREKNAAPPGALRDPAQTERNEVKSKPEKPRVIAPRLRENESRMGQNERNEEQSANRNDEERSNRPNEQRPRPRQERQVQQDQNHQMQNAPAARVPEPEAAPEVGQKRRQETPQKQQPGEQGAEQRKGKGKKAEGEATPPPQ